MPYSTLYYGSTRISSAKHISLMLEKKIVYDSIYKFGFFIFTDKIIGSSGSDGFYKIGLRELELEKLIADGRETKGSMFFATSDRVIAKRNDDSWFEFVPFSGLACEANIEDRVYTGEQVANIGNFIFATAKSQSKRSIVGLSSDLSIDLEFPLGFYSHGFAVSECFNRIVAIGKKGEFVCFDLLDTKELWRVGLDDLGFSDIPNYMGSVQSYVHVFDNLVVAGYANLHLVALDLNTGGLVWKQELKGDANFPCVDWRGRVYKVSRNELVIIDARTGDFLLQKPVAAPDALDSEGLDLSTAFCDVTETHFFGITPKGLLFAVNLETAEMDWYDDTGEMHRMGSPFIIDRNRLYLQTTMSNKLVIYEGEGGFTP